MSYQNRLIPRLIEMVTRLLPEPRLLPDGKRPSSTSHRLRLTPVRLILEIMDKDIPLPLNRIRLIEHLIKKEIKDTLPLTRTHR